MHYYQHNIKSFNNATMYLTRVERSLYRDLIELYYDTEQPLPADDFNRLARKVGATSDDEKTALNYVLGEFFHKTGDVWSHDKCDAELEKYHNTHSAKAKAGKASAAARKKKAAQRRKERKKEIEQNSTGVEQPLNRCATNNKPTTTNKQPIKKENKKKRPSADYDFSTWPRPLPDLDLVDDFLVAKKKARGGMSQRAISTVGKQLMMAVANGHTVEDCLEAAESAGWKSFKAEYMGNGTNKQSNSKGGSVSTFDWAAEQAEQADGSAEPQQNHGAISTDGSSLQLPDATEFKGWQR